MGRSLAFSLIQVRLNTNMNVDMQIPYLYFIYINLKPLLPFSQGSTHVTGVGDVGRYCKTQFSVGMPHSILSSQFLTRIIASEYMILCYIQGAKQLWKQLIYMEIPDELFVTHLRKDNETLNNATWKLFDFFKKIRFSFDPMKVPLDFHNSFLMFTHYSCKDFLIFAPLGRLELCSI